MTLMTVDTVRSLVTLGTTFKSRLFVTQDTYVMLWTVPYALSVSEATKLRQAMHRVGVTIVAPTDPRLNVEKSQGVWRYLFPPIRNALRKPAP